MRKLGAVQKKGKKDFKTQQVYVSSARVVDGQIPNTESLDGFFAALSCCPDLVMPSEYLPIIKSSASDEGELIFEDMNEAERFMNLINRH